ncbi:MAG TPA: lysophospholipid acyltransferase family protein [Bacillota bacterium]|nr:lysophospholipid acyltransferase family protein [Bacillota bacterium]
MYSFLLAVVGFVFRLIFRIDAKGSENIPAEGPLLVCSNHIHNFDPVIIAMQSRRQIRFMAKAEAFEWPVLGYLVKAVGAFPVKRGGADISAIRTSLKYLKEGAAVGIFPEGTRSKTGELGEAHQGVMMLADSAKAIMVPVGIVGPYKFMGRIKVRIGEPVMSSGLVPAGAEYTREAATRGLMQRIEALRRGD